MKSLRPATCYLAVQAIAGGVWWASLFIWPESRRHYWPSVWPEAGLLAFWLPDLLLFVGGSAASAWLIAKRLSYRHAALWLTCGATLYAALFCCSLWLMTDEAAWSTAAMAPCAVITLLITWAER